MKRASLAALMLLVALVPVPIASGQTPAPQIVDVAQPAGLFERNYSYSANPADYDADGDTDVLIVYHGKGGKLWRNDGGRFTRVAARAWPTRADGIPPQDRHDCAWGDANVDGRLDTYCTMGRTKANHVKYSGNDNELWLQRAGGSFADVGTTWGVSDNYGRGRSATFINANGDAFPDLFVGNELPRPDDPDGGARGENKLFLNRGGRRFDEAQGFGLHEFLGASCAHAVDYDRDGWQDLFVCGTSEGRLYHNNGGTGFSRANSAAGVAALPYADVDFGDLDGDGDHDLVTTTRTRVAYQLNVDGRFKPPVALRALTAGRDVALGDLNGDSDLDVYVLEGGLKRSNPPDRVLLNRKLDFGAELAVPAAAGNGDTVEPLDYNSDRAMDFVALNGAGETDTSLGPVQLLTLSKP